MNGFEHRGDKTMVYPMVRREPEHQPHGGGKEGEDHQRIRHVGRRFVQVLGCVGTASEPTSEDQKEETEHIERREESADETQKPGHRHPMLEGVIEDLVL